MPAGGAAGASAGGVSNAVLYVVIIPARPGPSRSKARSPRCLPLAAPSTRKVYAPEPHSRPQMKTSRSAPAASRSIAARSRTYPLGTNQIMAFQGATLAGVSWDTDDDNLYRGGPGIGFGNAAGN